ncbi:hypothetical protein [Metaclostridioides mangenotii]|uniref:hypothetical protein n=1 Tax=Metaclostridioides mangenotii TaxID=1540 RepID=UPI000483DAF6|nr:hypothetical protein [Clostridioides mangenotii]
MVRMVYGYASNHHTWFDKNIIRISVDGDILIDNTIDPIKREYIEKITTIVNLPNEYLTPEFVTYVKKRYNLD